MSVVVQGQIDSAAALPLLRGPLARAFAMRGERLVSAGEFLAEVLALVPQLPPGRAAINLCEDRHAFLIAFCALSLNEQINLLPPSRTPQAIAEVLAAHPGAYCISEVALNPAPPRLLVFDAQVPHPATTAAVPLIPAERVVAIGYTSGSTGTPKANPKQWGDFCASTAKNAAALGADDFTRPLHLVATVPPQHMYGLELSVLLPLLGACAVHAGKPLFPADVARALHALPAPRALVSTPVHLRALVRDSQELPQIAAIVSATAPLSMELAAQTEQRFAAPVIEVFGSTETCVIAQRRTAHESDWNLYADVQLKPQPDGTLVEADHLAAPVMLQDIVELLPNRQFRLCGRNADLLEIAGKRASLGDLTRRLLALPGVEDGAVFQLDADCAGVQRLAALVVAPTRSEADLLEGLRQAVDAAFLPRPLKRVAALPRNETGKLPRAALLALLANG